MPHFTFLRVSSRFFASLRCPASDPRRSAAREQRSITTNPALPARSRDCVRRFFVVTFATLSIYLPAVLPCACCAALFYICAFRFPLLLDLVLKRPRERWRRGRGREGQGGCSCLSEGARLCLCVCCVLIPYFYTCFCSCSCDGSGSCDGSARYAVRRVVDKARCDAMRSDWMDWMDGWIR